jgi:chemotaxis methyl-accepting protein methylase
MSISVSRQELNRFRCAIVERTGLYFDDGRLAFLKEVLQRRVGHAATSTANYLINLEHAPPRDEMGALAQDLTVNETYFFRHYDQFRAFAEVALPERMRTRDSKRTLSLLSAGCASGEEAYSLAIVTQELVDPSWDVSIQAIDLNPAVLRKAAQGRYSEWALREAPAEVRRNWFRSDRRELVLADAVRNAVQFSIGNLAGDDPALWPPATYDVIFCRNVLMYFSPEQMRAAIGRLARAGRISVSRTRRNPARHLRRFPPVPHPSDILLPPQEHSVARLQAAHVRAGAARHSRRTADVSRVGLHGVGRCHPRGERARIGAGVRAPGPPSGGPPECAPLAARFRAGSVAPRTLQRGARSGPCCAA